MMLEALRVPGANEPPGASPQDTPAGPLGRDRDRSPESRPCAVWALGLAADAVLPFEWWPPMWATVCSAGYCGCSASGLTRSNVRRGRSSDGSSTGIVLLSGASGARGALPAHARAYQAGSFMTYGERPYGIWSGRVCHDRWR